MAILPEVLLRLWRVGDIPHPNFHFFLSWEFGWSRAFRPADDDDLREFYSWFDKLVQGESFDEYIARMIKTYFDANGEHDELTSLRFNFYRGHRDGGNIVELIIKSDIDDVVDATNTVMASLMNAFELLDGRQLNSYWISRTRHTGAQASYYVNELAQFYAEYTRCHWGTGGQGPSRNEEWISCGPSSEVREMVPVSA